MTYWKLSRAPVDRTVNATTGFLRSRKGNWQSSVVVGRYDATYFCSIDTRRFEDVFGCLCRQFKDQSCTKLANFSIAWCHQCCLSFVVSSRLLLHNSMAEVTYFLMVRKEVVTYFTAE